tara:strand:+ start:884 stop:1045 length:162 start_codon:yes stop_codon:yes gene_type:complete
MSKSRKAFEGEHDENDRKRKLNYKKRKQRSQEPKRKFKNIRSWEDLDEDEYNF